MRLPDRRRRIRAWGSSGLQHGSQQEFPVPFGAEDGGSCDPHNAKSCGLAEFTYGIAHFSVNSRVPDDSTFPHAFSPRLELWLDERRQRRSFSQEILDGRDHQRQRYEGRVYGRHLYRLRG
jgi:hypothetical protein